MIADTFTKFIIRRRTVDKAWDVRKLVRSAKLIDEMDYTAGEMDITLSEVNDGFAVHNGDIVEVEWNGHKTFYGYVFSWELDKGDEYKIIAYDSLRYFKSTDSIVFPVTTLGQRFNTICKYLGVKHKAIKTPSHKLKAEICDQKTYFSMLQDAINKTRRATGERYFLTDNWGTIELRKYPHYELKMILGDESLVTDYSFKRDIDNTANVIKVVKNDSSRGKKSITTVTTQGKSIKTWGKLVQTKSITQKSNRAQMLKQAKDLLKQKNKQNNELKLTVIGNIWLQAGNSVTVNIKDLKDVGVGNRKYLIEKATHNFGSDYTVDLVLRV